MLLLNIIRKPYMGSPMALSNLTWTLKGQNQSHGVVADLYGMHIFASGLLPP